MQPPRGHLRDSRQRLVPVVHRYGGKGRVLLAVHGMALRQALALVLGGRVVGQGLVVAGSHVLGLECCQGHRLPGF